MMKSAIVALCLPVLASAHEFGPNGCVSVSQSPAGTCMISTDCEGEDISHVEFAFNCERDLDDETDTTWLSYGIGSFDAKEDFDTEVKCTRCALSTLKSPVQQQLRPWGEPKHLEKGNDAEAGEEDEPPSGSVPVQALYLRHSQVPVVPARAPAPASAVPAPAPAVPAPAPTVPAPAPAVLAGAPSPSTIEAGGPSPAAIEAAAVVATPAPVIRISTRATVPSFAPQRFRLPSTLEEVVEDVLPELATGETFGPDSCVSTRRSPHGTCILQTRCALSNITGYNFGLVCEGKDGGLTRHMFGERSFAPEETFDTLISCEKCFGPDNIPNDVALAGEVRVLEKNQKDIQAALNVVMSRLRIRMVSGSSPPAPPPAPPRRPAATLPKTANAITRQVATPPSRPAATPPKTANAITRQVATPPSRPTATPSAAPQAAALQPAAPAAPPASSPLFLAAVHQEALHHAAHHRMAFKKNHRAKHHHHHRHLSGESRRVVSQEHAAHKKRKLRQHHRNK